MPSVSGKQHRLMAAVAHNPAFAKKVGIPQSVGEEFSEADIGKKFKEGGRMKESKKMIEKEVSFMKKKHAPKSMIKHEEAEAKGYKHGGHMRPKKEINEEQMEMGRTAAYKRGGGVMEAEPKGGMAALRGGQDELTKGNRPHGEHAIQKRGHTKGEEFTMLGGPGETGLKYGGKTMKYAKGGYVRSADGIASKGKTKGRYI